MTYEEKFNALVKEIKKEQSHAIEALEHDAGENLMFSLGMLYAYSGLTQKIKDLKES